MKIQGLLLNSAKYAICQASEKSDSAKSGLTWELLLLPIVVGEWSHLRLGVVQIDIGAGWTDVQIDMCKIYILDYINLAISFAITLGGVFSV